MVLPPGPVGLKFWQPRIEVTEASWAVLYSRTLTTNSGGWTNYTHRQVVGTSTYESAAPATGSQLRVTIQSSTTDGVTWDKVYIGHAAVSGDASDFDGTQVQVLFSGVPGGTIAAGGVSLVSDPVTYAFDKSRPLVISSHISGSGGTSNSLRALDPATGFTFGFKSGDFAATTDDTGYTESADQLVGFTRVEIYAAPVGDSGPVTLPAATGSYTLTGTNAGLGPGYQLTGFDAAFTTASAGGAVTLTAAAGSYALTGTAAALAYSATLTAGAGSYALTGSAVGLGLGYWLTGSDVTFTTATAGGTTLTAAAGSYTLTGSAAALALRHTAAAGSYSLTGTAAVYRITLAAGAGSYALTGSPAGFLAPFNLPAGAGTYTLTGSDAALTVISGIVLFCGSGSYALTGFDAAFIPPTGPVEPTSPGGVGSVSRGRMIRKRRKREEEEEPIPVIGSTPVAEAPPGPSQAREDGRRPDVPPQPGLMAHMPPVQPAKIPKRADPDEDEDEIALLLELIS